MKGGEEGAEEPMRTCLISSTLRHWQSSERYYKSLTKNIFLNKRYFPLYV